MPMSDSYKSRTLFCAIKCVKWVLAGDKQNLERESLFAEILLLGRQERCRAPLKL